MVAPASFQQFSDLKEAEGLLCLLLAQTSAATATTAEIRSKRLNNGSHAGSKHLTFLASKIPAVTAVLQHPDLCSPGPPTGQSPVFPVDDASGDKRTSVEDGQRSDES